MVGDVFVAGEGQRLAPTRRVVSLIVALALFASMLLLVADKAEAAPSAPVAAAVSVDAATAQFNISAIVCPILLFLRAAFGPFFAGIFDSLLAAFGCINVSPGGPTTTDDDNGDNGDN
jgi:hypothetical protein